MLYIIFFLLEVFHLPIQIIFRLMVLINRIVTVSQAYSQALLDGFLVVPASRAILRAMQFILALRHPRILAQNAVTLRIFMLEFFLP